MDADAAPVGDAGEHSLTVRSSRMSLVLTTGLVLVLFAATAAYVWSGAGDPAPRLNELVSSNAFLVEDGFGQHPDWIELHNPSDQVIDLRGWGLSDGGDPTAAWRFPAVQLDPEEYLVVFASGRDGVDPDGNHHTDFRLDRTGEAVSLVDPDDVVRDRAPSAELVRNQALGRSGDDPSRWCHHLHPTPGAANGSVCWSDAALGAPELSIGSGFYDDAIDVELSSADGAEEIWYTLDGSYPDLDENPDHTLVADGPIRIEDRTPEPEHLSEISLSMDGGRVGWAPETADPVRPVPKGTVLRARSPHGGETVATYFVGAHHRRPNLPVASLSFDEEFLFDERTGLFMPGAVFDEFVEGPDFDPALTYATPGNFQERGREWERPGTDDLHRPVWLDWCEPGGDCAYQTAVGVRVHGGASRVNIRKSVRLYARAEFGSDRFDHAFFAGSPLTGHRRLILRTGGNNHNRSILADAYLHSLMTHFKADVQAARPVALFLNGEYWGLYLLRERYDQHYLEVVHGADPGSVVFVDLRGPTVEAGDPGDVDAYVGLLDLLARAEPGGRVARDRIDDALDLESFFDFLIAHIYVGNRDWAPNNALVWRQPDGIGDGTLDGRWRWLIIDLDLAGADRFDPSYDAIASRLTLDDDLLHRGGIPLLFDRVMAHPELRDQFLARFADHLNTTFLPERTVPELDRQAAVIAPEIPVHIDRWRSPADVGTWEGDIDTIRDFMQQRPAAQRQQLQDHFGLSGTAPVTVRGSDGDRGHVRINTIELVEGTPGVGDPEDWSGEYFLDVPIELEAVPAPGFRFVRWDGAPANVAELERFRWTVTRPLTVEAVFESVE